jgi:DNA helicase HerA-like ATPase
MDAFRRRLLQLGWTPEQADAHLYRISGGRAGGLPEPEVPEPEHLDTPVVLGSDISTGAPVSLGVTERMNGVYVIGKNGTGKSSLIASLIAQDMRDGRGLCLLDPHGDLTHQVIRLVPPERRAHVLLLDAGNEDVVFGLNPLQSDGTPRGIARTADAVVQSFKRAWGSLGWGARLEMTLYNLAYALASAKKTLVDVPDFFYREDARQRVLAQVTNQNVVDFWRYEYDGLTPTQQRELRSSTFNKIKLFLDNPLVARIVGQQANSVDWRWAMDHGRIVLVRLPEGEIGEGPVNLLGSTIVDQIAFAVRSRANVPEAARRPFFLFADEFHRFATPAFAKLLDELRKYGIATLMAHQRRAQLGEEAQEAALGARNFVVFEVTARDAAELRREVAPAQADPVSPLNLYEQLERKGHPDPEVRRLVSQVQRHIEFWPVIQAKQTQAQGRQPDMPIIRGHASKMVRISTRPTGT